MNNTSSMDQVLPSLSVTGYVASSLSISVFLMVYSALITSLRLRSILNTRTEPLRAEPRRFCFSQFVNGPESPPTLNRKKLKNAPPAHSRPESGSSRIFEALARCGGSGGSISLGDTCPSCEGLSVHGTDGGLVLTLEPAEDLRDYHCIGNTDWLGPLLELGSVMIKRVVSGLCQELVASCYYLWSRRTSKQ
jgi:hypothetical protein